jgi:hypothetical protein
MPHIWLCGTSMAPEQRRFASQGAPGKVQVPQFGLQHTSPTLHVFGPHQALCGTVDIPHTS